eukprot:gene10176-21211_t
MVAFISFLIWGFSALGAVGFLPKSNLLSIQRPVNEQKYGSITINQGRRRLNIIVYNDSSKKDSLPLPNVSLSNIPNILTTLRIVAIPFFILSFALNKKAVSVGIYTISCITDFLDGYIARKWNQTSAFGAFLDPVADKLMVATALILLVCQVPTWWFAVPVALIMAREITVSALREWMAERGSRATVKVGPLGKVKTAVQMIATALILTACPGASDFDIAFSLNVSKPAIFNIGLLSLYIATALTLISGYQYLRAAWPFLTDTAPTTPIPIPTIPSSTQL